MEEPPTVLVHGPEGVEVVVLGVNSRYKEADGSVLFETYIPPSRDAIYLKPHVIYLLMAGFMVLLVSYAIIGHLFKDLIHDLADWLFGEQPEEVLVNWCEAKDKFMEDWCPETSPELEELARAEELKERCRCCLEGNDGPAIWIISDGIEPRVAKGAPQMACGKS